MVPNGIWLSLCWHPQQHGLYQCHHYTSCPQVGGHGAAPPVQFPSQRVTALQASPCRDFSSTPFAASRWLLPAHTKGCDQLLSFIPSWGSRGLGTWCSSILSCYMEVLAPALGKWWCHAWVSGNCLHLQVVTKNTK